MDPVIERLQAELDAASADLKAHMASWAYAFAMGSSHHGGAGHPAHVATRRADRRAAAALPRPPRAALRAPRLSRRQIPFLTLA